MASLSEDRSGARVIQFVCPREGRRRTVRLGHVPKRTAEAVKVRVEQMVALVAANLPMDGDTAQWVASLSDDFAAKLAAVGLVGVRSADTLGPFLDKYVGRRKLEAKKSTMKNLRQVQADLVAAFGAGRPVRGLTAADGEAFRDRYVALVAAGGLASATASRRLRNARMFLRAAVKSKLVDANPFDGLSITTVLPRDRQFYVTEADGHRLIAAAANDNWRAIVALARFGGVRCPSELLPMEWARVDFARGRMTVLSPKTEHHAGRGSRETPLFPALLRVLRAARANAAPGERFVVGGVQGDRYRAAADGPNGWQNSNLRTTFLKLVKRAGLTPWPKIFQNLRASLETDLMQAFPIHVVTAWLGNTPAVALKHYLQVRDDDFKKALHFALHGTSAPGDFEPHGPTPTDYDSEGGREMAGYQTTRGSVQMPRVGLEPPADSADTPPILKFGAAPGAVAPGDAEHHPLPFPARLRPLVAALRALPPGERAAVVRAAERREAA